MAFESLEVRCTSHWTTGSSIGAALLGGGGAGKATVEPGKRVDDHDEKGQCIWGIGKAHAPTVYDPEVAHRMPHHGETDHGEVQHAEPLSGA